MSDIYVQEPPCEGKVCFETTVGEIDIELWSRECPKVGMDRLLLSRFKESHNLRLNLIAMTYYPLTLALSNSSIPLHRPAEILFNCV